jgi:tRNA 2-selenouridine synthase SelU
MDILLKNHDISQLSNFHTPATAQYYFEISSLEDISKLTEIYNFSEKNNLPVLIV